jgi:uncharacterized repeat protein (TIGR01451 family)
MNRSPLISLMLVAVLLVSIPCAAQAIPAIRVTKLPVNQTVKPGAPATWTITVSNAGETLLSQVQVIDSLAPECQRTFTELYMGASTSYTCSHAGETSSYSNTATAIADSNAGFMVQWNDSARVTVVPWSPSVQVAKTPKNQTVYSGQPATFTLTVTNTGDTDLSPIIVQDFNAAECSKNLTGLGIGASTSWTCSHAGETVSYYNVVQAQGWSPLAQKVVMWNDSARVNVLPWSPSVQVAKTPRNQTVYSGQPAGWTITVTNTGNTNLSPIIVQDFNAAECSRNLTGLGIGASTSWTCSHAGETASYYNVVQAQAWSPLAQKVVMWNDSARVNVVPVVEVDIVPVSLSSPVLETPVIENEPAPDTEASRPEADFIADLQSGYAPLTVTFTDLSTGNPDNWYWDFGDGSTSTGPNQEHSYFLSGTYTVTLTVSNARGTDGETQEIIVSAPTPPVEEITPLPEIQEPTGSPGENNVA